VKLSLDLKGRSDGDVSLMARLLPKWLWQWDPVTIRWRDTLFQCPDRLWGGTKPPT